ncbi:general substrate transporter, partial [Aureobasidium melanogenum]
MTRTVSTNSEGVPTYWGRSGRALQMLITTVATTDFLLFGYDQGVMSGIIEGDAFLAMFPQAGYNSSWQGFIVSIYAVGCLCGAIFILKFGDKLGRRRAIFIGGITMIIGVIIQICCVGTSAGSTAQFIVGRFITGIGNGINTSTIPTYQAECSKAHNRGKVICIEGGNVAVGTLIAYWIDFGCSYGPDNLTWRFPIAFQIVFAVIVLIITTRLPESPRWLLSHDRQDEATVILAALNAKPADDPEVKLEASILLDSIKAAGGFGEKTSSKTLLTGGKTQHFRRMMLGASSQFMQQLSGCNAVIYYFPVLFRDSIGTTKNMSNLLGGINMIVYALFATTSMFLVERVGRRKLYLYGTVGQCLSMVLVFACLIPHNSMDARGAAVGLFTYIAFFGATWLPLPWLYPAEINPLKTRAKANAFSTVNNWLWNFFIVMITPVLIDSISWGTYLFFAVLNALFFPVIYWFFPETSGRSLEEIDLIFAKGYLEKMNYVTAAKELPHMNPDEIDAKAREYGFQSSDDEAGQVKDARFGEKEDEIAYNGGGQMA